MLASWMTNIFPAAVRTRRRPGPDDVQPASNETLDRVLTGLITVLPIVALFFVGWQLWDGLLHPSDLVVFVIMYLLTGLGVTVGFHRLFILGVRSRWDSQMTWGPPWL